MIALYISKFLNETTEKSFLRCSLFRVFEPPVKATLLLAIMAFCVYEYVLCYQNVICHTFETILFQMQWMLTAGLILWCGFFLLLTFSRNDLLLIGLLLIAMIMYFISHVAGLRRMEHYAMLLAGVTLGKWARVLLSPKLERRRQRAEGGSDPDLRSSKFEVRTFLVGLDCCCLSPHGGIWIWGATITAHDGWGFGIIPMTTAC